MKLRLPSKLQAALIATLASAALTTLSTGTAAYAATSSLEDAELQLVDFTTQTMTDAATAGWTISGFTGSDTGIYTSTASRAFIHSENNWTTTSGGRTFWAGIFTINLNDVTANKSRLLQDAAGTTLWEGISFFTENGVRKADGAWQGDHYSSLKIDANLADYADANGNITLGVFYKGGSGTAIYVGNKTASLGGLRSGLATSNPNIYLADAANAKYTNLFLFGAANDKEISDAAMQSMMKTAAAYYWNGSADATWTTTSTNWNHYGSNLGVTIGAGNANTNVVFGADGVKTVAVEGSITVGDMAVESAGYAFNMVNDARLTVAGTASIDHTIQVTGGTLTLNGKIDVDTGTGLSNYDVYKEGTITYTDGTNGGFINTNTTQYTLVKGTNTTVDGSYTFADAGVAKVDGADGLVFTYNPTTPAGVYYILASQSYNATKMGAATEFMVQGNNVEFTAAGIQLAGKALTLGAGTIWKTGNGGNFNNQQVQKLTLLGDAKVNPAVNGGIIGASDGETFLDLQGHTLTIASSSNHFALFNTTALSSGTISIDDNRFLQIGHSQKTSSARLNDVVLNFGGANAHLTIDCNSTLTVEGLTGNGTIQRDGGSTPTLILAPTLENASYTFTGKFTTTAKLVMDKASTGTQAINVSTASTIDSIAVHGGTLSIGGTAALTVNNGVTVDGGTLDLGNRQHTGISALTINDGGTVKTASDNGNGMVGGTITINAGGTLQATKGAKDIFGYNNGATDKVVMQGSEAKQAKIDLSGLASGNSVTMTTNLEMKGYSTISGGAINSFNGAITVSGTGNTISDFELREAVTIDVAAGGALEIGTLGRFPGFDKALTKTGDGSLTLKGGVIDKAITMNAGSLALDGTFTVDGIAIEESEGYTYYGGKYGDDPAHSVNGERWATLSIQLANGDAAGNIDLSATPTFMFEGSGMVGEVSTVTPGQVDIHSTALSSTFYINQGTEETAWIKGLADEDPSFAVVDAISLAGGTTLVVNDNAADGFDAGMIHMQGGAANLQIETGNKVLADGTDRALQLSGAGEYKLNGGVGLGSLSTAATTATTPWTGTIDATAVGSDKEKLYALYTSAAIHGGTVLLKSVPGDPTSGEDNQFLTLQLAGDGGKTGDHTFAQTTFKTENGGNLKIADWQRGHSWIVGEGTAFDVDGAIRVDNLQTLSIRGGSVTTGGKIVLGHSGSGNASGLNMTSGSLKTSAIQVIIGGTGNPAPISITGGTLEFTSATPLLLNDNSAATVTLGGSGADYVTLKADGVSWSLAHDGMTIGNIKAETTNNGAITLGAAGKVASYTGSIEVAENSSLTLDGILTLGANGIVTSGVLGVSNTTVFNLEHMEAQQVGDKFVYNVFTGAGADLSTQSFTAAGNIIGISTAGKEWTFGNDGTISYVMLSSELVWKGVDGIGVWDTTDSNKPWLNGEASSAFRNDDEVTFDSTYSTAATATLGGNVEAASITVAAGANVHVAQDAQETYTLTATSLVVNGTLTSDMPIDSLQFITVGTGATWNTANALDITDNGGLQSFSNEGTIKLLSGARMDVDMTAGKTQPGVVTAAEGGTLHLHNVPGSAATFNGHNDFLGTLVYDVVSTNGHDASVTLENFNGTLELRGRLAASASNFGGMTKLVLNGDRSSNTTGLWNQNALTLSVPVEVKGDETVDLYTSNALTLTGDINSAGAKQGHLSKRNGGDLNLQGGVYLLSYDNNAGTVNMSGAADITTLNVVAGTVNMSGSANIATLNAENGTVALGGQDKTYTLGAVALGKSTGGAPNLTIGAGANVTADTVKVEDLSSATIVLADDLDITDSLSTMGAEHTLTIKSADGVESAKTLTTAKLDIANVNTGIALQNVILVVNGKASVAEIITGCGNNRGNMSVGAGATLNLNGGVNWSHDGKYVNLAIADGGDVNISTVAGNVLNDLTIERGGDLTIGAGATTSVEGTATISDVITADANIAFNGAVNINGMSDAELTTFTKGQDGGNGFKQFGGALTVVDISGGGSVSVKEGTVISYNGKAGELGADGKFHLEETTVEYDAFFVNTNDTGESLDHALAAAEAASGTMTTVQLADGTSLAMDRADATLPHLVLKEGASSATLNVTQSSSIASVEGIGAGQTLNITGTTGKVLTLTANNTMTGTVDVQSATLKTTTETTLGNAHVDVAAAGTLELGANLTLANGMDNAGTISMAGKTLTLNGTTAYNLGNVTGNDQSYITVGNNATAVVDGNVTVRRVYGNAGSNIKVEEGATLNLLTTGRSNYSEIHGDLDIKGTVSFKSDGGDMRFWGTSDNQVFNLGHLVVDGGTGQVDLLTAGGGNYTSTIAAKSLSGGSLSHILEVTTCYTGGTAGTGKVVKFVIGDENSTATAASYTGTIKYGVGSGSVKAGGGMNLVIKDEYVAANAVLQTIMSGGTYGTVTVDTERAKVKGLKDATSGKTVNVSGTAADKNRVLEIVGNDNYTYNGKLGANLDVVHSGSGTQSFGGVDGFDGSLAVEGGVLNILNAASVDVHDVTINNGTLGVYNSGTATADTSHEGTLTIESTQKLTAGGNATLNANLVMDSGSTLDVTGTNGLGLAMGSSVTLNTGMTLEGYSSDWATWKDGTTYVLFTGVDSLNIGSGAQTAAIDYTKWVDAKDYFTNLGEANRYFLCYTGADSANGGVAQYTFDGSNVGTVYIMVMPEPTTGTLSLLALCALAARRRRK